MAARNFCLMRPVSLALSFEPRDALKLFAIKSERKNGARHYKLEVSSRMNPTSFAAKLNRSDLHALRRAIDRLLWD